MSIKFRYQIVLYSKDNILVHECFADNKTGIIDSLNPSPVVENRENSKAIERDSLKYLPVKVENVRREMKKWKEEVEIPHDDEDREEFWEDEFDEEVYREFYEEDEDTLDVTDFIERNR